MQHPVLVLACQGLLKSPQASLKDSKPLPLFVADIISQSLVAFTHGDAIYFVLCLTAVKDFSILHDFVLKGLYAATVSTIGGKATHPHIH